MIEWIQHWDEMRFYYWSGLNWLFLLPVYIGGIALITVVCWLLAKLWKPVWLLAIPAVAWLAVAPFWEELNIAWNFGQVCKKDAGIFIYKTVEVEGFYDATAGAIRVLDPVPQQTTDNWDKRGYRFYEQSLADTQGGPARVVHYEKRDGVWKGEVLDQPTARYHYTWPHMDTPISHKVDKIERIVEDIQLDEVLARETKYRRKAPWFFIGLDRPVMLCPGSGEHPLSQYGSVFNLALKPK